VPSPPLPSPQGYFYVEAHKEAHVKEALKGLRMMYQSKPPKLVRSGAGRGGAGRRRASACPAGVAEPGLLVAIHRQGRRVNHLLCCVPNAHWRW